LRNEYPLERAYHLRYRQHCAIATHDGDRPRPHGSGQSRIGAHEYGHERNAESRSEMHKPGIDADHEGCAGDEPRHGVDRPAVRPLTTWHAIIDRSIRRVAKRKAGQHAVAMNGMQVPRNSMMDVVRQAREALADAVAIIAMPTPARLAHDER